MDNGEIVLAIGANQQEEYQAPQITDSPIQDVTYGSAAGSADSNGQGQY